MKKYIKGYIKFILVFCLIFLFCSLIIDWHRDGVILRDGSYSLNTNFKADTFRLAVDVADGKEEEGLRLQLWPANYSSAQQFTLENVQGNEYIIWFGSLCVGVNDEIQGVVLQTYEGQKAQHWYIDRINTSQYFKITNCESGLSMQISKEPNYYYYTIKVSQYLGSEYYYFQF